MKPSAKANKNIYDVWLRNPSTKPTESQIQVGRVKRQQNPTKAYLIKTYTTLSPHDQTIGQHPNYELFFPLYKRTTNFSNSTQTNINTLKLKQIDNSFSLNK